MRRALPLVWIALLAVLSACARQQPPVPSGQPLSPDSPASPASGGLPALDSLERGQPGLRRSSASDHELLTAAPLQASTGAVWSAGSLSLDAQAAAPGPAFAVFALSGLPLDGSSLPTSVHAGADAAGWLACANFAQNRWELLALSGSQTLPLANGAELLSPGGSVYVALLAYPQPANPLGQLQAASLRLELSGNLPGGPTAVLSVEGERHALKYPVRFNAAQSSPGLGSWTSFTYNFGDGSPEVITTDPATVVEHTYTVRWPWTVVLTVQTDQGGTVQEDTDSLPLEPDDTIKELLLVYNSDMTESADLADYYCRPETGRGIDPACRLPIPLGSTDTPAIDRAAYETEIRNRVKAHIDMNPFKDQLRYILLCKGLPHQITGINEFGYYTSTYSSVDSELCTLFSDGTYPVAGHLWNEIGYRDLSGDSQSFFMGVNSLPLSRDYDFAHGQYLVSDVDDNQFPLDYLVGRLSAYTYAEAKLLVDRALAAESAGSASGWVLMDTSAGDVAYDTMADPVWPKTDSSWDCGSEVLTAAGQNNYIDLAPLRLTGALSDGLPAGCAANIIALASWGLNQTGGGSYPSGSEYILKDFQFNYLPGAAFLIYESFNGTDFDASDPDNGVGVDRRGQGQVCDFLHMGGTVGIGNAYEPWTSAMGDERVIYYRYVVEHDRWIEAAYKGLRMLSWQEVVVGDPLCRLGE